LTFALRQWGSVVSTDPSTDLLSVNGEFTASIVIAKCQRTPAGSHRWRLTETPAFVLGQEAKWQTPMRRVEVEPARN